MRQIAQYRFSADEPTPDDVCIHDLRRFEKCAHCLEAENERLRDALRYYANKTQEEWVNVTGADDGVIARAALEEKE